VKGGRSVGGREKKETEIVTSGEERGGLSLKGEMHPTGPEQGGGFLSIAEHIVKEGRGDTIYVYAKKKEERKKDFHVGGGKNGLRPETPEEGNQDLVVFFYSSHNGRKGGGSPAYVRILKKNSHAYIEREGRYLTLHPEVRTRRRKKFLRSQGQIDSESGLRINASAS